jgi:hypothetical protein
VHIPFIGLWHERRTLDFSINVLAVMLPLIAVMAASAADVLRQGWRSLLRDAVPLTVILYGLLLSFTYWFQWADVWGASRLAAPAVVLGTLVVLRQPWVQWRSSFMTLMALGALIPLIVVQR